MEKLQGLGKYILVLFVLGHRACEADETVAFDVAINTRECIVEDFGAKGDGTTNDQSSIQAAIDACSASENGGAVIFHSGKTYLSGALVVSSRVTLRLQEGATLLASAKREDYHGPQEDWYFILIDKATRVSVEGPGSISGQSLLWRHDGHKDTEGWEGPGCRNGTCHPSLIGIRDSSQVSLDRIRLREFARTGVRIERSEAVAIVASAVATETTLSSSRGVVVDGSKRVFVGQTTVQTGGPAVVATDSTGRKPLESLLVDNVTLRSASAAFQVGPVAEGEVKTIVVQNSRIDSARRGLSVQLQDAGSVHDIWFTNMNVTAQHMEGDGIGAAECMHVSVRAGESGQVGKMSNVWFGNVTCEAEGGLVASGEHGSTIEGVTLKDCRLLLRRLTNLHGAYRDFRPAAGGRFDVESVPAIFIEHANHVSLANVEVQIGNPSRREWGDLLQTTPHTVHVLSLEGVRAHDETAHPSSPAVTPMRKMSQLGDFFKHSVREWANAIGHKGFISLQENAAFGVAGRRAASSGSPLVMLLLLVVLLVLLTRYCCLPFLRERARRSRLLG